MLPVEPRHQIGGYQEFTPSPEAAFFCEAFWTHQAGADAAPGAAHRVLPDPAVSVAFRVHRDSAGGAGNGAVVLIGAKTRPHVFPVIAGVELAAVRLKLEWVAPILGVDPGAIDNSIVDLADVRPGVAAALDDTLRRTRSAAEVLPVLARTLLESRASRCTPLPAATAALEIVRRTAGRVPCQRVADAIGVSARHLRRQVQDSAGLSPKAYARVLRLAHAMRIADRSAAPRWADVAARSGYCDQSHLIREAIALGCAPPEQLHAERRRQSVAMAEISNIA